MRVLLLEDDPDISSIVSQAVASAGFAVDAMMHIADAQAALLTGRYAIILIDRRLPDGDGLSLLSDARRHQPGTPVLVLSALDESADVVRGLDAGADDYMTKPLNLAELLARVRVALRKAGMGRQPPLVCAQLTFDTDSREVHVADRPFVLKRRELAVLESLIRRKGRVVLRDTLIEEIYAFDDDVQSNTLDAHVSRLRARLKDAGAGVAIHPVRGVGYMLTSA